MGGALGNRPCSSWEEFPVGSGWLNLILQWEPWACIWGGSWLENLQWVSQSQISVLSSRKWWSISLPSFVKPCSASPRHQLGIFLTLIVMADIFMQLSRVIKHIIWCETKGGLPTFSVFLSKSSVISIFWFYLLEKPSILFLKHEYTNYGWLLLPLYNFLYTKWLKISKITLSPSHYK